MKANSIFTSPHFFKTPLIRPITARTSTRHAAQIKQQQKHARRIVNNKQGRILKRTFNGELAYTVQERSPKEAVNKGGLEPSTKEIFISTSGYNHGSVCMSLLPEIPCIMHQQRTPNEQRYLYALPLHGDFFIMNGQWRQVISPGGLTLPTWWRCRSIRNHNGQTTLGPLVGQDGKTPVKFDEAYSRYLSSTLTPPPA